MANKLENYLDLLKIRQKGRRRDAYVFGGIFWLTLIAELILLLTGQLTGRAIVIVSGLEVVIGIAYLMAWVRLEQVRNNIDLIREILD